MTNTISLTLLAAITFNGAMVEAGEIIELPSKSAESLIAEGQAKRNEVSEAQGVPTDEEKVEGEQLLTEEPSEPSEDDKVLKTKALDDKYKGQIPALKEHAKEVDVQFAHDATKAEIIEAIITAGKDEAVLAK